MKLRFCAPPAPPSLLRVHVRRLRRRAPQPAPPDPVCHPGSPGRLLSRRRGPAAPAPFNEEISAPGPRGNPVLTLTEEQLPPPADATSASKSDFGVHLAPLLDVFTSFVAHLC